MHPQTIERLKTIESRIGKDRASLSDLKTQLSHNPDKHVQELLQQAANWLDDAEVLYLGILRHKQTPPRTLDQESWVLNMAEFFLVFVAEPQLKATHEMVARFGRDVQFIR